MNTRPGRPNGRRRRNAPPTEGRPLFDHQFSLDSPTGALLNVYQATPEGRARAVLLVNHGLAEHAGRYAAFARDMAARGFVVYAHDHRGHGSTTAFDAPLRRFAKVKGGPKLVADCRTVHEHANEEHHGLPVVAFGHSMGGLIAANYAIRHGGDLAGLAVWNARFGLGLQERLAVAALKLERMLKGSDAASAIFTGATVDAWGKAISPRRTAYDWLSHDPAVVDAFLAEPLCGWSPTVSMAGDIVGLVAFASDETHLSRLPRELSIHLLGGTHDPATNGAAAVRDFAGRLRHSGSRDVTLALVEGARHETHNEIEPYRGQALASLAGWMDRILPPR